MESPGRKRAPAGQKSARSSVAEQKSARSSVAEPVKGSKGSETLPRRDRLANAGAEISNSAPSSGKPEPNYSAYAPQLSLGVDTLVQQLANVRAGNVDLQSRLALQDQEVAMLQMSGINQQRALLSFQQKMESAHRAEVEAAEARASARSAESERKLRADLKSCQQLLQDGNSERQKLLAELSSLRHELGQAKEARRHAETAEIAARENEQALQAELQQAARERQLMQAAFTQQSLILQSKEVERAELQERYKRHIRKAKLLLSHEKEKLEVVSRLDGVLPRNILMKAISD